ncbi:helix-turn-helix domain-containing protein [Actinomyces bowdenii]|uniref:helix-turn-helix domain-containing protein n=1 Tax=Actinomyces bowdenii TaxID=131109 RepID=UPI00214B6E3A|nr:helix-turn-helix transcriptional regulator [Actinomyces bowdenii]MCR2051785.1 helix-turn-helix domain-containing protein [Actinomyces bowdenii]
MSTTTDWTAKAIRAALADSGHTKRYLSEETGIPYPTLNRKVAGRRDFTFSELLAIAKALQVHPATLVPPQFKTANPAA